MVTFHKYAVRKSKVGKICKVRGSSKSALALDDVLQAIGGAIFNFFLFSFFFSGLAGWVHTARRE